MPHVSLTATAPMLRTWRLGHPNYKIAQRVTQGHLSIKATARLFGVHWQTLHRFEMGTNRITPDVALLLALYQKPKTISLARRLFLVTQPSRLTREQLRAWRQSLSLTKTDCAPLIGVMPAALHAYESGRVQRIPGTVQRLGVLYQADREILDQAQILLQWTQSPGRRDNWRIVQVCPDACGQYLLEPSIKDQALYRGPYVSRQRALRAAYEAGYTHFTGEGAFPTRPRPLASALWPQEKSKKVSALA